MGLYKMSRFYRQKRDIYLNIISLFQKISPGRQIADGRNYFLFTSYTLSGYFFLALSSLARYSRAFLNDIMAFFESAMACALYPPKSLGAFSR